MQRKKVHNVHHGRRALHSSTQAEPTHSYVTVLTSFPFVPVPLGDWKGQVTKIGIMGLVLQVNESNEKCQLII